MRIGQLAGHVKPEIWVVRHHIVTNLDHFTAALHTQPMMKLMHHPLYSMHCQLHQSKFVSLHSTGNVAVRYNRAAVAGGRSCYSDEPELQCTSLIGVSHIILPA